MSTPEMAAAPEPEPASLPGANPERARGKPAAAAPRTEEEVPSLLLFRDIDLNVILC